MRRSVGALTSISGSAYINEDPGQYATFYGRQEQARSALDAVLANKVTADHARWGEIHVT